MTHVELRCRCGAHVAAEPFATPPPPGTPTEELGKWRGWLWVCHSCGTKAGVTYDYGELDLGIVRDSVLIDRPFP